MAKYSYHCRSAFGTLEEGVRDIVLIASSEEKAAVAYAQDYYDARGDLVDEVYVRRAYHNTIEKRFNVKATVSFDATEARDA